MIIDEAEKDKKWGGNLPKEKDLFSINNPILIDKPKSSENIISSSLFDFKFPQAPFPNMNMNILGCPPPNLPPVFTQKPQFSIENFEASFINMYPMNQDHTSINLFSIFTNKIPNGDINEPVWSYKDPQGDTQGPFSSINMDCWNLDKYFPLHLPIAWNQTIQFVTIDHFKNQPFSLINLAHRYGGLTKYIPNFDRYVMNKNISTSAKLPMNNNMGNMNNMNNIFNRNPVFSGNLNNIPMNMTPPLGNFSAMGNVNNLSNMMNINNLNMNLQANMKFQNNQMNFKNEDTLAQLLRLVEKNSQINMNFNNYNRMSPSPNLNFNADPNANPNFQFQKMTQQQQPNINMMQNLNNMNNFPNNNSNQNSNNNNGFNNNGISNSNIQPQSNQNNNFNSNTNNLNANINNNINTNSSVKTNNGNTANTNAYTNANNNTNTNTNINTNTNNNSNNIPINNATNTQSIENIQPTSQQQAHQILVSLTPNPKINTNNLKMMLGLNNLAGNNEPPKEKKEPEKRKEKAMIEKRNAEFPSLSEAMGKQ